MIGSCLFAWGCSTEEGSSLRSFSGGFVIHLVLSVLMTTCPIRKKRYKLGLVCYYKAVTQVLVIKVNYNGKDTTKQ